MPMGGGGDDYAPLYDVIFPQPGLDLTSPQCKRKSVLEALRLMTAQRPQLVERAEENLARQN